MRALISQRIIRDEKRGDCDALEVAYTRFFEDLGVHLIPVGNALQNIEQYRTGLIIDGIILSGGNDIDTALYGETPVPNGDYAKERDATETQLLELAMRERLPVLGICRGMQFINVFFGGKLSQDVTSATGSDHLHPHDVDILEPSAPKYLSKKNERVTSFHKRGILKEFLAPKLRPFAIAKDGTIEGFYHEAYPIAGIMWHPEREGGEKDTDIKLMQAFIMRQLFWKT